MTTTTFALWIVFANLGVWAHAVRSERWWLVILTSALIASALERLS